MNVTTTDRGQSRKQGIALHRVRSLHPADRARRDRIPVTSLPRTLLDLAEVWDAKRLTSAVEEADRLGLLEIRTVEQTLERSRGRRGPSVLREVLAAHRYAPITRSELERRFLDFCRELRLPEPSMNVLVEGFEADAYWPRARLMVELDGYAFHRTRAAFERDHSRDVALRAAGYEVVRVTWRMLEREGPVLARTLRNLLGAC